MTEIQTKKQRLLLKFPKEIVTSPIVFTLIKDYNLRVNIFRATINPSEEGEMGLELEGTVKDFDNALAFLKKERISFSPLYKEINWNKELCTHCSSCSTVCPAGALEFDKKKHELDFLKEKCIACGQCVDACPYKAITA